MSKHQTEHHPKARRSNILLRLTSDFVVLSGHHAGLPTRKDPGTSYLEVEKEKDKFVPYR